MEKTTTIRQAAEKWLGEFDRIPGNVFKAFAKADQSVSRYDSDLFRLMTTRIKCLGCGVKYQGNLTIDELWKAGKKGKAIACEACHYSTSDNWQISYPKGAFPCSWDRLFSPRDSADMKWLDEEENRKAIAKLGFFVFKSQPFGYLLGRDTTGLDFYEFFWIPLYKLRGLDWHTETSSD